MSRDPDDSPVERYLDELTRLLAAGRPRELRHLLSETEAHLHDDTAAALATGTDRADAEAQAVARLGAPKTLANAELDPGINETDSAFNKALHDELCKAGPDHCPTMLFEKGESHMSEVFSIDTSDKVVSGPILKWIKSIK